MLWTIFSVLTATVALSAGAPSALTSAPAREGHERTTARPLDDYISFEVSYVETDPNGIVIKYESPTPNQKCYAKATWRISDMKLISIDRLYPCSQGCEVCITQTATGFKWNCACTDVGCP